MNNTQSIIVYRSPIERQLYESGLLFPIMTGCLVFFLVALVADKIVSARFGHFSKRRNVAINTGIAIAAACGLATVWKMAQF